MDTITRPQRRYGDQEQAEALAVLEEQGGNAEAASRITGIPPSTLKEWRNAMQGRGCRPASAELVKQRKAQRSTRWADIADMAQDQVLAKLPEASARDAAVIAGIAEDKRAMLDSDTASTPDPEAAARLELFRANYAASQALHVHVHLAPGPAVTGPAPIVLEPLQNKALEGEPPEVESAGS